MPSLQTIANGKGRRQTWLRRLAVASLLSLHVVLGLSSKLKHSTTYDELAHLTGGFSYWKFNDYRLQPENGNLPQRWGAIPLLGMGLDLPERTGEAWDRSNVWAYGLAWFHAAGTDRDRILFRGRAAMGVLSAALCLTVYLWSRRLFGTAGGLVSLVLATCCPTLLAHGFLVTSDVCASLFLLWSLAAIWSLLRRVSLGRVLLGGLAVGGLLLSKFSALLILPLAGLLTLISLAGGGVTTFERPGGGMRDVRSRSGRLLLAGGAAAAVAVVGVTVVWAAFGFRYAATSSGDPVSLYTYDQLEDLLPDEGVMGSVFRTIQRYQLLPEAWLMGCSYVLERTERQAFLNGEHSTTGWWHFFPYCLLVKTPLPLLLLVTAAAVIVVRRAGRGEWPEISAGGGDGDVSRGIVAALYRLAPLLVLLAVVWPVLIFSKLNIGHRHLLPTYPALWILAGGAGLILQSPRRTGAMAVGLLLVWSGVEAARGFPHYLAYFNQLVDRDHAYQHLVDSNLDWGQDLPGLKDWLEDHHDEGTPVYLLYFGMAVPQHYGIEARPLRPPPPTARLPFDPGVYCISATRLQGLFIEVPGPWTADSELQYQQAIHAMDELVRVPVAERTEWLRQRDVEWPVLQRAYQTLLTARLLAYLRGREPEAHVGYSILIFRLTEADIREALLGPPPELDNWTDDL